MQGVEARTASMDIRRKSSDPEGESVIWVGIRASSLGSLPRKIRDLLSEGASGFDHGGYRFEVILSEREVGGFGVVAGRRALNGRAEKITGTYQRALSTFPFVKEVLKEWGIENDPEIWWGGYTL